LCEKCPICDRPNTKEVINHVYAEIGRMAIDPKYIPKTYSESKKESKWEYIVIVMLIMSFGKAL